MNNLLKAELHVDMTWPLIILGIYIMIAAVIITHVSRTEKKEQKLRLKKIEEEKSSLIKSLGE